MTPDAEQLAVIEALVAQVPAAGWTEAALRRALVALGRAADEAPLIFPNGVGEMIEVFAWAADRRMEADAAAAALSELRLPERVRAIIALRLARNGPYKVAIRRSLVWLALPGNAGVAARIVARTVDAIWHAAGDLSADFSWYTKRGILAGVYGATLLFWLRDMTAEDDTTLQFLDRRLADVGRIGAARKKLQTWRNTVSRTNQV